MTSISSGPVIRPDPGLADVASLSSLHAAKNTGYANCRPGLDKRAVCHRKRLPAEREGPRLSGLASRKSQVARSGRPNTGGVLVQKLRSGHLTTETETELPPSGKLG